ncbi:MAG: hypothetical protein KAG64_04520 [Bacteroidales bacterium]|nr:hypothetical protein [Bacteroidales bacterium]
MSKCIILLLLTMLLAYSCGLNHSQRPIIELGEDYKTTLGTFTDNISKDVFSVSASKLIGNIKYGVQYTPYQYHASKSILSDTSIILDIIEENPGLQQFILKFELDELETDILKYNVASHQEYESRISYLAFDFQNRIKLIEGSDSLSCKMYHFERTYGLSTSCTILLGFESIYDDKSAYASDKQIIINDNVFGGGIIKLKIRKENLNNIPVIKIKI